MRYRRSCETGCNRSDHCCPEYTPDFIAFVENETGVLARISGLFSGKSYNLDSLTVGATEDSTISRMTISLIKINYIVCSAACHLSSLKMIDWLQAFAVLVSPN